MEPHQIIILTSLIVFVVALIFFAIAYTRKSNKVVRNSQEIVSDKDLLIFMNSQPDKMVDYKLLMKEFGLSKFEANGRLRHFLYNGLLRILRTKNGMKAYYTLANPIEHSYELKLTDDPFMTIEDLMMIFKHYDYQVTLQQFCLSTGLPVKVILEEMKYFEKEKVVKCLYTSNDGGFSHKRVYALCEPYRSNPDNYLNLRDANFELKEIYQKADNS